MDEHECRRALADFLRKRRATLTPAEVGLPPGLRRRTPGLRREEVAQLASMGTSWYVWLEQGRDVHPSAQILESLAQALRLTPNERRHLFLLAAQPLPAQSPPMEEKIPPALQQMLDDMNPTPAYVMGRRWDYLAWNQAASVIFDMSETTSLYGRNLVWRLFTNPAMREHRNWELVARGTLAEFRTSSALYPGDPWFEEMIEDLKQVSPEFCRWWPQHDARRSLEGPKTLMHAQMGRLEFEHITLQVFNQPDLRIVVYSPLPETRRKLVQFMEMGQDAITASSQLETNTPISRNWSS